MTSKASTEELFNAAVQVIRGLPKNGSYSPSHQLMLRFYGFYKQATEGPCEHPKPSFWDVIGKAKWDAWKKLGDMPKEQAMLSYVEELKKGSQLCIPGLTTAEKANIAKIVETMAYTDQVEKFMDILDPFFDLVDFLERPENFQKVHKGSEDLNGDSDLTSQGEAVLTNGSAYNHDEFLEMNNAVNVKGKENMSEKYYSDSDSENDEFSDPIEIQSEEMKVFKKYRIDHNDNDSGFADQAEGAVNGQDDHSWIMPNGSIPNGVMNGHAEDSALFVDEKGVNAVNLKGMVARGGGDQDEPASGTSSVIRQGSASQDGRGRGQRDSLNQQDMNPSGRRHPVAGLGSSGRAPGNGLFQQQPADINEQIAMALLRLQRDMDSVLARLNVLETVALAQHNTAQDRLAVHYNAASQLQVATSSGPSWWPFKDVRFRTFLFFIAWPFIVQIIIKIIANRRARIIQLLLPLIIFVNDRRLAMVRKR